MVILFYIFEELAYIFFFSIATSPFYIPTSNVPFILYALADLSMKSSGVSVVSFTLLYKGHGPCCIPSIMSLFGIYCLLILILLCNFVQRSCVRGTGYTLNPHKEPVNVEVIFSMPLLDFCHFFLLLLIHYLYLWAIYH